MNLLDPCLKHDFDGAQNHLEISHYKMLRACLKRQFVFVMKECLCEEQNTKKKAITKELLIGILIFY